MQTNQPIQPGQCPSGAGRSLASISAPPPGSSSGAAPLASSKELVKLAGQAGILREQTSGSQGSSTRAATTVQPCPIQGCTDPSSFPRGEPRAEPAPDGPHATPAGERSASAEPVATTRGQQLQWFMSSKLWMVAVSFFSVVLFLFITTLSALNESKRRTNLEFDKGSMMLAMVDLQETILNGPEVLRPAGSSPPSWHDALEKLSMKAARVVSSAQQWELGLSKQGPAGGVDRGARFLAAPFDLRHFKEALVKAREQQPREAFEHFLAALKEDSREFSAWVEDRDSVLGAILPEGIVLNERVSHSGHIHGVGGDTNTSYLAFTKQSLEKHQKVVEKNRARDMRQPWIVALLSALAVATGIALVGQIIQSTLEPLQAQALALRESQERNRIIVESAQDAFVVISHTGVIVDWNHKAEEIFGWKREEVIGSRIADTIIPPRARTTLGSQGTGLDPFLTPAGDLSTHKMVELTVQKKGGKTFPVEATVQRIRQGSTVVFGAFLRDITERRTAEEELRASHDETQLLLASLPAAVILVDNRGRVVRWNHSAETTFGIPAEKVLGKQFHDVPIQWKWNLIRQAVIDCFAHGQSVEIPEITFTGPHGKARSMQLVLNSAKPTDSHELNYILLGVDITQRRHLEGQLRQAQKMESIGQLAAGIAHEINTPTQFIGDNLRFLRESFDDLLVPLKDLDAWGKASGDARPEDAVLCRALESIRKADISYLTSEVPQAIQQSLEGTDRVSKIVRAMKEFSHPSADERKPLDLNRSIESTLTVARNEWKYVADVTTAFDPDLPPVPCFPGDFNQAILNLVVNAAHAIADTPGVKAGGKGKINITTRRNGTHVDISIRDSGTGIPAEIRDKIYDPFFTTKEVGKGTGQGLFIVHSVVVEKHGGSISFESQLGQGTTFKISLPLDPVLAARSAMKAA